MDAKNFLFCSLDAALIGDVAWQVHREGHDAKCYIEAEGDKEIADSQWRPPAGVGLSRAERVVRSVVTRVPSCSVR